MDRLWDSPALRLVPVSPRVLAEDVATELGQVTGPVVEVVRLHLEALDSALALSAPELLSEQLRWQRVRLRAAGTSLTPEQVDGEVRTSLAAYLDHDAREQVAAVQNAASALSDSADVADALGGLAPGRAQDYLGAALAGQRDIAVGIIREAILEGVDAEVIMLDVLQPAQVELGRLWELGVITVAHEHYTTAITQLCLSLLYPRLLLNRTLLGRSVVATAVGSEAHEVGIRMVSDLLEHAGWRTAYLGANVPNADVVDRVAQQRADVLAISATMAGHIRQVRSLIADLRADPRCAGVRTLVGGRPFVINPALADAVGADGCAADAREALALCREWAAEGFADDVGQDRVDAG